MEQKFNKSLQNVPKGNARRPSTPALSEEYRPAGAGYFKQVKALPGYQLEVIMETGTVIQFDFRSRLKTARFGRLRNGELFASVHTDGGSLIFKKEGEVPVRISAQEFMDLVMIDRTKIAHVGPE